MSDALYEAILLDDLEAVTFLLSAGVSVNQQFPDGSYPLNVAIAYKRDVIIQLLLEANADKNQPDSFRLDCCRRRPIHYAAGANSLSLVKTLLRSKVDVNQPDEGNSSPLHHAAANGHLEVVEYLLSQGCDVHTQSNSGRTALWKAAVAGHEEVVHFLYAGGARIDIHNQVGATVLFDCAKLDALMPLTELLITLGIDVNSQDIEGNTALHLVASLGKTLAVSRLLQAGSDVNRRNDYGNGALHNAAMHNQVEVMVCLLNHGADFETANRSRQSPLYAAMLHQQTNATRLLHNLGSRLLRGQILMYETYEMHRNERKMVFYQWALSFFRSTKSLKTICRAVIRRHLKHPIAHSVFQLPLPASITSFLALEQIL